MVAELLALVIGTAIAVLHTVQHTGGASVQALPAPETGSLSDNHSADSAPTEQSTPDYSHFGTTEDGTPIGDKEARQGCEAAMQKVLGPQWRATLINAIKTYSWRTSKAKATALSMVKNLCGRSYAANVLGVRRWATANLSSALAKMDHDAFVSEYIMRAVGALRDLYNSWRYDGTPLQSLHDRALARSVKTLQGLKAIDDWIIYGRYLFAGPHQPKSTLNPEWWQKTLQALGVDPATPDPEIPSTWPMWVKYNPSFIWSHHLGDLAEKHWERGDLSL